jgi:hypothetical protein
MSQFADKNERRPVEWVGPGLAQFPHGVLQRRGHIIAFDVTLIEMAHQQGRAFVVNVP